MTDSRFPTFELRDTDGARRAFPTGRPAVLVFARSDCPTCTYSLPLVEEAARRFGSEVDVWLVSQDEDGGAGLAKDRALPVLDDGALRVSHAFALESVPTVCLADPMGRAEARFEGFARADWAALFGSLARLTPGASPEIDASAYVELRPGCGSRSLEPGIVERLEAEASGSPLRARAIELGPDDDPIEFLFEQGFSDGLPLVPPTPERVLAMLGGTRRDAQEVVAIVPPNYAPVTVEKVAINAVMAGARPEFLPVVITALEAACSAEFNLHGVLATTYFPTPVVIVNGPVRRAIGMNAGMNCLGQGNRANLSIGRALQLVVRNLGGGRPGEVDRATLGQPGKISLCFAENEERSPWPALHVDRGLDPESSAVTVVAGGAPNGFMDQLARSARALATSYGLALAAASHPKHYFHGQMVVIVPPEHADTFRRDGWSKDQVREQIQAASARPASELARDERCAEGLPPALVERLGATPVPKFRSQDDIMLVVAGGEAGKFGAYLGGWVSGPTGSSAVTRAVGA